MAKDIRESREPRSGAVVFASGDAGTAKNVLTIRDEATLSLNDISVTYSAAATNHANVVIYDEPEGTASGDLSDMVDRYELSPGDSVDRVGVDREDIENDVVVVVSNNDADMSVSFGGKLVSG
jgi:hypothetical protein